MKPQVKARVSFSDDTSDIGPSLSSNEQDSPPSDTSSEEGLCLEVSRALEQSAPRDPAQPPHRSLRLSSVGYSEVISPVTDVEPDYDSATDTSEDDEDEEEAMTNNIYEQVLGCSTPRDEVFVPSLPGPRPLLPTTHKQSVPSMTPRAQAPSSPHLRNQGFKSRAKQLKETLSTKLSVRALFSLRV